MYKFPPKIQVPPGLRTVAKGLSRAVVKTQPENIKIFAALYFSELLQFRAARTNLGIQDLIKEFSVCNVFPVPSHGTKAMIASLDQQALDRKEHPQDVPVCVSQTKLYNAAQGSCNPNQESLKPTSQCISSDSTSNITLSDTKHTLNEHITQNLLLADSSNHAQSNSLDCDVVIFHKKTNSGCIETMCDDVPDPSTPSPCKRSTSAVFERILPSETDIGSNVVVIQTRSVPCEYMIVVHSNSVPDTIVFQRDSSLKKPVKTSQTTLKENAAKDISLPTATHLLVPEKQDPFADLMEAVTDNSLACTMETKSCLNGAEPPSQETPRMIYDNLSLTQTNAEKILSASQQMLSEISNNISQLTLNASSTTCPQNDMQAGVEDSRLPASKVTSSFELVPPIITATEHAQTPASICPHHFEGDVANLSLVLPLIVTPLESTTSIPDPMVSEKADSNSSDSVQGTYIPGQEMPARLTSSETLSNTYDFSTLTVEEINTLVKEPIVPSLLHPTGDHRNAFKDECQAKERSISFKNTDSEILQKKMFPPILPGKANVQFDQTSPRSQHSFSAEERASTLPQSLISPLQDTPPLDPPTPTAAAESFRHFIPVPVQSPVIYGSILPVRCGDRARPEVPISQGSDCGTLPRTPFIPGCSQEAINCRTCDGVLAVAVPECPFIRTARCGGSWKLCHLACPESVSHTCLAKSCLSELTSMANCAVGHVVLPTQPGLPTYQDLGARCLGHPCALPALWPLGGAITMPRLQYSECCCHHVPDATLPHYLLINNPSHKRQAEASFSCPDFPIQPIGGHCTPSSKPLANTKTHQQNSSAEVSKDSNANSIATHMFKI